jgi:PBSX family phage terminase large subunit
MPTIGTYYKPNKKQKQFHKAQAKFRAFVGGIGSGKTFAGGQESFLYATNIAPGSTGIIIAPTYKMLNDSTQRTFLEIVPAECILEFNIQKNYMRLVGGSEIFFRSADDPDSIRGINASWAWMDEGGKIPTRKAWDVLIGRLRQKGFPARAWVTTTPKGYNWLYEVFIKNKSKEHAVIYCSTYDNRENLQAGFIESLESQYVGAFLKQELMGEFVGLEGLVYPEFNVSTHVIEHSRLPVAFHRVLGGIDFGVSNPTAVCVFGFDDDDRAYLIDELYKPGLDSLQLIAEIKPLWERYKVEMFYADPARPEHILALNSQGIPVKPAINDVMKGIQEVASRLHVPEKGRPMLMVSDKCTNFIDEVRMYHYPEGVDGKPLQENPVKVNDHMMDSVRYLMASIMMTEVQVVGGFGRLSVW